MTANKGPTTYTNTYGPDLAVVRFQVAPRGVLGAVEAADVGPAEVGVLQGLFCMGGLEWSINWLSRNDMGHY